MKKLKMLSVFYDSHKNEFVSEMINKEKLANFIRNMNVLLKKDGDVFDTDSRNNWELLCEKIFGAIKDNVVKSVKETFNLKLIGCDDDKCDCHNSINELMEDTKDMHKLILNKFLMDRKNLMKASHNEAEEDHQNLMAHETIH